MRGEWYFTQGQRRFEEPLDHGPIVPRALPTEGVCPYCGQWLLEDDGLYCDTDGCKYDEALTEEENRAKYMAGGTL